MCGVEMTFGVRLPEEVRAAKEAGAPPYQGRGKPPKERPAPLHTAREVIGSLPEGDRRGLADGELKGGDQGDFEQANGSVASAPGDRKPSTQHRP